MEELRLKNIDFLKFIGAISIVYFHMNLCSFRFYQDTIPLFKTTVSLSGGAGMWVELFFIISAFFLFKKDIHFKPITFLLKKYLRLYPIIIFMTFLYWFLSKFHLLNYRPYENIFAILSINGFGMTSSNMGNIHPSWFSSVLLWASFSLIWLKNICSKSYFDFIIFLNIIFVTVFLSTSSNIPWILVNHTVSLGFLRGIDCISIGYVLSQWYKAYQNTSLYKFNNLYVSFFCTILEAYFLVFVILNTFAHKFILTYSYMVVLIAEIFLFVTFLLNKGLISKFLNNNISKFLGEISYSIIISHIVLIDFCSKNIFPKYFIYVMCHPYLIIFELIISSIILGCLSYIFIEKPIARYLKNFIYTYNNNHKQTIIVSGRKENIL